MNKTVNSIQCAAIDLGASGGRLIEGRLFNGQLEIAEVARFQTPMIDDAPSGYQCWDIDQILARVEEAIAHCAARDQIESLGVDGWGVDYVLLDAELQQIGKAVCYRDKRTAGTMDKVRARMPGEEIYRLTGVQFQPFNTLFQLAAAAEQEPEWMDAASHLLMIPDYIHFRLCGVLSNEYTNATTTQMYSIGGKWDERLLQVAGLKRNLMQPPIDAATMLGKARVGTGWAKVISPATHDTASAVAGAPLEDPDEAYISSGTWSLMGVESQVPIATPEAMRMNFTNEGGLERRYRVLKNIAGMWPLQRICKENDRGAVDALIAEATVVPAWASVVNLDDPLFLNPRSMTESIRSYCRQTGQPEPQTTAQLARCVFDSLALSYRNVKEQLERLRQRKLAKIRIVGGGCRNRLLNQICADACQLPVCAGPVEASALGNLSAQMIALGAIENLDEARALIRASFSQEEFRPRGTVPDKVWRLFLELLKTTYRKV